MTEKWWLISTRQSILCLKRRINLPETTAVIVYMVWWWWWSTKCEKCFSFYSFLTSFCVRNEKIVLAFLSFSRVPIWLSYHTYIGNIKVCNVRMIDTKILLVLLLIYFKTQTQTQYRRLAYCTKLNEEIEDRRRW